MKIDTDALKKQVILHLPYLLFLERILPDTSIVLAPGSLQVSRFMLFLPTFGVVRS